MKYILYTILIVLTAIGITSILNYGMNKSEIAECLKLQKQSTEYKDFYLTYIEKEMCDYHSIKINAPVK